MTQRCPCPIYCRFCGAKRKRDFLGHKCPTHNCQWQFGYSTCTLHEKRAAPSTRAKSGELGG